MFFNFELTFIVGTKLNYDFMKKLFILYLSVFSFGFNFLHGQTLRIYDEIQQVKQSGLHPEKIQVFHSSKLRSTPAALYSYVKNATLLEVNRNAIRRIISKAPEFISMEIPGTNNTGTYHIELIKSSVLMPDFQVLDAENQSVQYQAGVYYHGIIRGDKNSIVAISFFEDDIIGVMSPEQGNLVIGKWKQEDGQESYLIYNERELLLPPLNRCGVDESFEERFPFNEIIPEELPVAKECKTVAVYLEADYNTYQKKGRSTTAVSNFITGLYNVVSTLYANEGINTKIKKLKIWSKRDPYSYGSSRAALNSFGGRIGNNFDGDLAHLLSLSSNNLGGLAWVDVLCQNARRYAFSNIGAGYTGFPTYSWSVEVITHEMGHNLGSPHTHRCAWGPHHNQALDNCHATEGGCPRGPAPRNGGTIMSYCHLTRYGINFRNGFGPEPGDLIRDRVRGATCLGTAFVASVKPQGSIDVFYGDSAVLTASPSGSKYSYQWYRSGLPLDGETKKTLVVKESGIYYVEVTTTCSVFAPPVKVVNKEFIASINYPPVSGGRDSITKMLSDSLTGQKSKHYTLRFSDDVLDKIPAGTHQWFVQLGVKLKGGFPIYLNFLKMTVKGPPSSGIKLENFYPADGVDIYTDADTFLYNLGKTNPAGTWTIDIENENGPKVDPVFYDIDLSFVWVLKSKASDQDLQSCEKEEYTLDAGIKADQYLWSTGDKTRQIIVTNPGHYSVTATKGSLVSSDDINILIAPTDYEIQTSICQGDSLRFGSQYLKTTGDYMNHFTTADGCDSNVTLHLMVNPEFYKEETRKLCFGEYFQGKKYYRNDTLRQFLQSKAGCDSTRIFYLKVSPQIIANVEIDTGCASTGSKLEVFSNSDSDTYLWSTGETKSKIYRVKEDSVHLTVTNSDGCTLEKDIEVPHFPTIVIDATIDSISCFGSRDGSIRLTLSGGTGEKTILWENKDSGIVRLNLGKGRYTAMVTDDINCREEVEFLLTEPDSLSIRATIRDTRKGFAEGSIVPQISGGTPPYRYRWSNGASSSDIHNLPEGEYSLTLTDKHDCQKQKTFRISVDNAVSDPKIPEPMLIVYPVPASKQLRIELKSPERQDWDLTIQNIEGKTVFMEHFHKNSNFTRSLDVMKWHTGVYFLQLSGTHTQLSQKIIIRH